MPNAPAQPRRAGPAPRDHAERRLLVLAAVMAVAATGLVLLRFTDRGPILDVPVTWWQATAGFLGLELLVFNADYRREVTSFSAAEAMLVLGLLALPVPQVAAAHLVGTGLALSLHRGQRGPRLVFNLAHIALAVVLAGETLHAIAQGATAITDWRVAVGAAAATLVAAMLSATAIVVSVVAVRGSISMGSIRATALVAGIAGITSMTAGLVGAVLISISPWMLLLLVPIVAIVVVTSRRYTATHRDHQRLAFLYDVSRRLSETTDLNVALTSVLGAARKAFRARVAEVTLTDPEGRGSPMHLRIDDEAEAGAAVPTYDPGLPSTLGIGGPARLVRVTDDDPAVPILQAMELDEALVAPMRGEHRILGSLVLGEREADLSPFTDSDVQLFASFVGHLTIALENGRLERTLAHVTRLKEQLDHRASHDALTELANRTQFRERVEAALASEHADRVGILYIDLDDFKKVNDQHGHEVGDLFLQAVANRIKRAVRPSDLPARLGGDEFAVLLHPVEGAPEAAMVAERVVRTMADPVRVGGHLLEPKGSVGVAFTQRDDTLAALLHRADTAMYAAKRRGGGVLTYHPDLEQADAGSPAAAASAERRTLAQAVSAGEVAAWHEPLIDLQTGLTAGTTALARWHDGGTGSAVRPIDLPTADAALAPAVTWAVLAQGAATTASWQQFLRRDLLVAVDLPPQALFEGDLQERLLGMLGQSGLAPESLVVELTEHDAIVASSEARTRLAGLRRAGIRVSIGGFGDDGSSLAVLRQVPADQLRLAPTLVADVDVDDRAAALCRGVLDLAASLGLTTVATGIERPEQLTCLRQWGCHLGQGPLLGQAGPPGEVSGMLADSSSAVTPRPASQPTHPTQT